MTANKDFAILSQFQPKLYALGISVIIGVGIFASTTL
jgi:hypothetical protein